MTYYSWYYSYITNITVENRLKSTNNGYCSNVGQRLNKILDLLIKKISLNYKVSAQYSTRRESVYEREQQTWDIAMNVSCFFPCYT